MTLRTRISSTASWVALAVVAALLGLGLLALVHRVETLDGALEESRADRHALHSELDDRKAESQALADQVKRLGGKPVVEPDQPKQGEPGPGPTATQVRAAVADYCAGDRCKPTVSRSQVAAAVQAYCANDACKGAPGVATDGADGTDGAAGAPGPGPTDEQVAAAVEAYCAEDNCRGEPGADGKDATFTPSGMDCPDGERVNGVHLLADGSLTVSCAPLIGRE